MLQIESVSSRIDQSRASRNDHSCSPTPVGSGVAVGSNLSSSGIPHQRFSFEKFEQELTFSPKLNATSLRLAHERRTQLKSGIIHRAHQARVARLASTPHHVVSNGASPVPQLPNEFTFKPQMSNASAKIAEGLQTTFMARQELHLQKQRQKLEQNTKLPLRGKLSPVPSIAKTRRLSLKEKENEENSQLAWNTPTSTPNLNDAKENMTGDACSKRLTAGSTPSLLNPVKQGRGNGPMQTSASLNKLQDSVYAQNTTLSLMRQRSVLKPKHLTHKRGLTHPIEGPASNHADDGGNERGSPRSPPTHQHHHRSKTSASPELSPRSKARHSVSRAHNGDRLKNAKHMAEKAMKTKRIFTIQGPYPVVRASLRRRAWVEKQYRLMNPHKFKKKNTGDDDSDSDDDDDIDDDNACDDANDDSGFDNSDSMYGIMSRMVRNSTPTFLWTVRKGAVDYKYLRKETIVNHFCKNGTFTTKVGLCTHLKSLPWYDGLDADTFFPRCYRICADEEKDAFLEDYRLSAAISVLRWIVMKQDGDLDLGLEEDAEEEEEEKEETKKEENKKEENKEEKNTKTQKPKKKPAVLRTPFVDVAIKIVEDFLTWKDHDDIDRHPASAPLLTDEEWDKFIQQYYQLTSEGGKIDDTTTHYAYCDSLLNRLRAVCPQLDMGGIKNIWIVKPGAKSRGRGIMCMNKLDEILKLVGNPLVKKEGKWVVQKYIERPLLIYRTKFDIRQWFLVTDWNPLTIWWYNACYLRFCTQPFSLDDFDQSIHLSNQSIQRHYENAVTRDENLPEDNMWDSGRFREYLDRRGYGELWDSVIVPGMKKAVICSMLCAQDHMEARKNSFELYGADFMLTDDFVPWMLEINASPAMGATSPVTEELCADVIEDTMKVVLDRRHDRNCDTGRFQILFKGPSVTVPPYVGAAICIDGVSIRKPVSLNRQKSMSNVISPRLDGGERRLDARRSRTPGRTDRVTTGGHHHQQQKPGTKAGGATPKATSMEDMKKKLAVSPARPQDLAATGSPETRDSVSDPSRGTLDGAWGNACPRCGSGRGYLLDASLQPSSPRACTCQRGGLVVPDPDLDEPLPPSSPRPATPKLRLTTARPPSSGVPRPPSVQKAGAPSPRPPTAMSHHCPETDDDDDDDARILPIPRAVNFVSNATGQLVTLNEGDDVLRGAARPGRVGFSQGKTRPNVNRQRRENRALLRASEEIRALAPMPAVLTNARR